MIHGNHFTISLSDHDIIGAVRKINNGKFPTRTVKCHNYKNHDKKLLVNKVSLIDWMPVYEATDVNVVLKYFNHKLKKLFDKHAPISEKRVKSRPCNWLSTEMKFEMDNQNKLRRKVQKSRKLADTKEYKK